ncbi:hypothetical protein [Flavitalea sp.]|nr:hypothetical protein [Flavitalea sp.]
MAIIRFTSTPKEITIQVDEHVRYLPLMRPRIYSIQGKEYGFAVKYPDQLPIQMMVSDLIYINDVAATVFEAVSFLVSTIPEVINNHKIKPVHRSLDSIPDGENRKLLSAVEYQILQQIIESFINS